MTLNLLKLCVGAESIADLTRYQDERRAAYQRLGFGYEALHTTRMVPKRIDELLDGGSLYWVIKGHIMARQRLTAIRPFKADDGITRCDLVMDAQVIAVQPRPCRPFQGWRYLKSEEAPSDLGASTTVDMPEELRRELAALGLL